MRKPAQIIEAVVWFGYERAQSASVTKGTVTFCSFAGSEKSPSRSVPQPAVTKSAAEVNSSALRATGSKRDSAESLMRAKS